MSIGISPVIMSRKILPAAWNRWIKPSARETRNWWPPASGAMVHGCGSVCINNSPVRCRWLMRPATHSAGRYVPELSVVVMG